MMMRAIRANTKWIMLGLAVAFAAWLVFDWVQSRDTGAAVGLNPVIALVNGQEIRYTRWSSELEFALELARSGSDAPLSDEEVRQVERGAWDGLINNVLIEQEIERLGIRVTDSEVRQAFRVNPPPDLMQHPAFQTDGRFDYEKYQRFFSDPSVDEALLLQIETYYRRALPRSRLTQQLVQVSAVSEARVWSEFRDRNETATVTFLTVDPADAVADDEVQDADSEMRSYYRDHLDDFERPATATVSLVSLSTVPSDRDTAAARALADSVRREIMAGGTSFEDAAAGNSADPATAAAGGELGRFGPGQLVAPLEAAAASLAVGDVSEPVESTQGFHLLKVSERTGDTATVQHILFPIRLTFESEDEIFDRMDELEGIALIDGLQTAADSLGIPISTGVTLTDGFDFVPGAGALGVAVDWALDPTTPFDEVSEFFRNATGYHVAEVTGRTEGGTFGFEEVEGQIRQTLLREARSRRALDLARRAMDDVRAASSLEEAGAALGWPVATAGPFTRLQFVDGLGRDTEAVGAAFGTPVGELADPADAGEVIVILRVDERSEADPELFMAVKEQIRAQLMFQAGQLNSSRWVQGLRETADIVDRRDRLNRQAQDA
jgi:peptidyl-prolyl cis-trans isomerase D